MWANDPIYRMAHQSPDLPRGRSFCYNEEGHRSKKNLTEDIARVSRLAVLAVKSL